MANMFHFFVASAPFSLLISSKKRDKMLKLHLNCLKFT